MQGKIWPCCIYYTSTKETISKTVFIQFPTHASSCTTAPACYSELSSSTKHQVARAWLQALSLEATVWPTAYRQCLHPTGLKLTFVDLYIIVEFIKKNPTRCNNVSNFIIPYLYEAQHVSGDTPPIIRSLKLHWQPLAFHTWQIVCSCSWWTLSCTLCLTTSTNYTNKQPFTYEKPEAECVWQRPPTTQTNNLSPMKNQRLPVQL